MDWRKYLKFRCTGCGNCCRGTVVMLTDTDVQRIAEGTGRDPQDFVRFFDTERVSLAKDSPWWLRFGDRRAVMALRWQRGPRCTFLDDENRCTIYDHRPVTCREHPFNVTVSDTGALERISLSRIVECPHDWDGDYTRRQVSSLSRWNERQSDAYTEQVRRWNRRRNVRGTRPGFLRFLGVIPDAE